MSSCPWATASIRGVRPSLSFSLRSTCFSSKRRTMRLLPRVAAICSGVIQAPASSAGSSAGARAGEASAWGWWVHCAPDVGIWAALAPERSSTRRGFHASAAAAHASHPTQALSKPMPVAKVAKSRTAGSLRWDVGLEGKFPGKLPSRMGESRGPASSGMA
ncbi:hypothetical protein F5883DRAFT_561263 [Diaporthe sp. PMI_573]|nr:hypothetical protein F5883DRAFT_561263 [Diaporthaceae sp. PMI_573]